MIICQHNGHPLRRKDAEDWQQGRGWPVSAQRHHFLNR
jgi:hypothetical protein